MAPPTAVDTDAPSSGPGRPGARGRSTRFSMRAGGCLAGIVLFVLAGVGGLQAAMRRAAAVPPPQPHPRGRGGGRGGVVGDGDVRETAGAAPPRHTLGICASVKDDELGLPGWIEFHRLAGVEHIYLIDDNSSDATGDIMAFYAARGDVSIIPGAVPAGDARCYYKDRRDSAYVAMCYDHAAPHLEWMAIIDVDEYMYPRVGCDLGAYLTGPSCSADASHVLLRWELFGSSGHAAHPPGLLAENFLTSGGDCASYADEWGPACGAWRGYCMECRHTKYIANTARCLRRAEHAENHTPNRLRLAPATCDIDPDGWASCRAWWADAALRAPAEPLTFTPPCCAGGIGLNHYAVKSAEARQWRAKRRMRNGLQNNQDATPPLAVRDLNWALSGDVLRFLPQLRVRVGAAHAELLGFLDTRGTALGRGYATRHPRLANTPVAPGVEFVSTAPHDLPPPPAALDQEVSRTWRDSRGMCFVERNWAYTPRPGHSRYLVLNVSTPHERACCAACPPAACLGFTYHAAQRQCLLLIPPINATMQQQWPPASLPAVRARAEGVVSGMPLAGEVCGAVPRGG